MFFPGSPDSVGNAKTAAIETADSFDADELETIRALPNLLGHTDGLLASLSGISTKRTESLQGLTHEQNVAKILRVRNEAGGTAAFAAIAKESGGLVVRLMGGEPEYALQLIQSIKAYSVNKSAPITVFVAADEGSIAQTFIDTGFEDVTTSEHEERVLKFG